jgi:hypothetical protein
MVKWYVFKFKGDSFGRGKTKINVSEKNRNLKFYLESPDYKLLKVVML